MRFISIVIVGTFAVSSCDSPSSESTAGAHILTATDIPSAAVAAIAAKWPGFQPYDARFYEPAKIASTPPTGDEGLTVVRGNFAGNGSVAFVVVGRAGSAGMVVAALPEGASYRVVLVAEVSPGLAGTPESAPVVLSLAPCEFRCAKRGQVAVRIIPLDSPANRPHSWFWDAKRGEFGIDSPVD